MKDVLLLLISTEIAAHLLQLTVKICKDLVQR